MERRRPEPADPAGSTGSTARPRGRRVGASGSREEILRSARELFAERGYAGTTIRAIAGRARVDPALVAHFFGGKNELFEAASLRAAAIPAMPPGGPAPRPDEAGHQLALAYLHAWEDPETAGPLLATARSALAHEDAMDRLRSLLGPPGASETIRSVGRDASELRLALAMSHLHGVAMARHVIRLPALVAAPLDELVEAIAPTIQRYLSEPVTESSHRS